MSKLFDVDWHEIFVPTHSILEMMVRGSFAYLGLFLILRFLMKCQSSTIGIADVLVIVVIADAAQNSFAKEYRSITEGVALILTIVFWDTVLNWLSFRFKLFERLLAAKPLPLIQKGKLNRLNMRKELITEDELRSHLRQEGLRDFGEVEMACLEANGEISVVKSDRQDAGADRPSKPIS